MSAARVTLAAIIAGCTHLAACGSFGTDDPPSATSDASIPDAATADGDVPDALDGSTPEGSTGCTEQTIVDDFPQAFPGWDLKEAGGLVIDDQNTRSPPTALLLDLSPSTTTRRLLARKLPRCRLAVSIWMRVQNGFGDGEVDLFAVSDSLDDNFHGLLVLGAAAYPNALSLEDPAVVQRKTSAPADTWIEVKMDVDPIQHRYEASIAGETFSGALPSTFGSSESLYVLVGAPYVDTGRTKPWKVSFDDLTIKVVP